MIEVLSARSDVALAVSSHDLADSTRVHTNLDAGECACSSAAVRPPNTTGDVCANCGGMAVRTGSCTTCTECGTTGGCG